MASFTEQVRILIDVVTDKGAAGLKDLQGKVGEAEGAFGKAKAAAGGFGDFLSSSTPLMVAGVGGVATAIAGFAIKAGTQFQDLALEVDNFRQKTGTTADEASRFVEVAHDLSVPVDALATAFGRFEREDASGALARYGLTAQDASGRFSELLQKIGKIPDENQRAAAAFQVFGKSWQNLAPLLDTTENLAQRLKDVQSGQLISDKQIAEARSFRDDLDNLNDSLRGFTTWVGEKAVAAVDALIKKANEIGGPIADIASGAQDVNDRFKGWFDIGGAIGLVADRASHFYDVTYQLTGGAYDLGDAINAVSTGFGLWGDSADSAVQAMAPLTGTIHSARGETEQLEAQTNILGGTIRSAQVDEKEYQAAIDGQTEAAKRSNAALADQKKALDEAKAALDAVTNAALASFNSELALHQAVDNLTKVTKDHKATLDDQKQALLGAAAAGAQYTEDQRSAAGETTSAQQKADDYKNSLELLKGQFPGLTSVIDDYINRLNSIPRTINTVVTVQTPQGQGYKVGPDGRVFLQEGGVVPGKLDEPVAAIVHGGEVVLNRDQQEQVRTLMAGAGWHGTDTGNVLPSGQYNYRDAQGNTMWTVPVKQGTPGDVAATVDPLSRATIIINMPPGSDGEDVVNALKKYQRRNGFVPIKTS